MDSMALSGLNRRDRQCTAFALDESLSAVPTTALVKLYGMNAHAIKRCCRWPHRPWPIHGQAMDSDPTDFAQR